MADKKHLIYKEDLLDLFTVQAPSMSYNKMFMAVANAPTVDAVEVVHGEWIMVIDENDCECIECPLCGGQFYDGDNDTFDKPYNYCPNCGADMRCDGNG